MSIGNEVNLACISLFNVARWLQDVGIYVYLLNHSANYSPIPPSSQHS